MPPNVRSWRERTWVRIPLSKSQTPRAYARRIDGSVYAGTRRPRERRRHWRFWVGPIGDNLRPKAPTDGAGKWLAGPLRGRRFSTRPRGGGLRRGLLGNNRRLMLLTERLINGGLL